MKKRYIYFSIVIISMILIVCRIIYVTKNARTPLVKEITQGECATYRGVEYSILDAVLWEYNDFFEYYENLAEYAADVSDETIMLLVVELKVAVYDDDYVLDLDIPIEYLNMFNGVDVFMADAMNPSLSEGTFYSGDSIYIPYEIYKENLTEKQWMQVQNGEVIYDLVLSTYPEKTKMMIEDICMEGEKNEGYIEN